VTTGQTDVAIMQQVADGDSKAMAEIYKRYYAPIYKLIRKHGWDHAQAEDWTQDTFMRVMRAAQQYNGERPLCSWLYMIAMNIVRDGLLSIKRRKNTFRISEYCKGDDHDLDNTNLAKASLVEDPRFERIEIEELSMKVNEAIARLMPGKNRDAFMMFHAQGMSYKDIAFAQGCPLGTVKSRIHAADHNLRNDESLQEIGHACLR
jgi:RNA polymerase sigma-70 factor (ECF subfamily)